MQDTLTVLQEQGAQVLTGGTPTTDTACGISNTLLRVAGRRFLQNPDVQQAETFWPTALPVIADNEEELAAITTQLEGGLTGTLYSHTAGADDELCARLAALMRPRVGRLLNDKMRQARR